MCAPTNVCAEVNVHVATNRDARSKEGEQEGLGGCCCYGNSQAGLSLISLPLCLLELWEETQEEGCPETATAFKRTVTTLSDRNLHSYESNTGVTRKGGGGGLGGHEGPHRTVDYRRQDTAR